MICSFILKYNLLFITKKMIKYQRACFIFQHAYSSSLLVGTVNTSISFSEFYNSFNNHMQNTNVTKCSFTVNQLSFACKNFREVSRSFVLGNITRRKVL